MNSTVKLFDRPDVVDVLTKLGWKASELFLPCWLNRWRRRGFAIVNAADDNLRIALPKDWDGETDVRFVLDGAIDTVDRLLVNVTVPNWERKVYLWHAKSTFASAAHRAARAEEDAKQAEQSRREAALLAKVYPDVPVEDVDRFTNSRADTSVGMVYSSINFDPDRQPQFVFKDPAQRSAKVAALLRFLRQEGWAS